MHTPRFFVATLKKQVGETGWFAQREVNPIYEYLYDLSRVEVEDLLGLGDANGRDGQRHVHVDRRKKNSLAGSTYM